MKNEIVQEMYLRIKKLPLAYDGSKKKIFRWIAPLLIQEFENADVILDGFSGTGIISAFLAQNDKQIHSVDSLYSSYILTNTLSSNPKEIIIDQELEQYSSHRCIDGLIFESDEIINIHSEIIGKYPQILTNNEANWIKYLNQKISHLSPYKKQIAQCAIRGISTIVPFSTSNGTKKFQNRIKQKDKYGQRCLGFYYNSSYEIEYIKWFNQYVKAFNEAVIQFSNNRKYDAIVHRDNIFNVLEKNYKTFDAAYFDPPYGQKHRIGYEKLFEFKENLLEAKPIKYDIFTNPENHSKNFIKLLEYSENIPIIIFSYDNNAWTTIDEISLICKRFGRIINIISTDHCHGKIPMPSHNKKIVENIIVAKKGK